MIVKKMPILQGFPGLKTVKLLSKCSSEFSEFNPIFYDIETTGLSKKRNSIYLIGTVQYENNQWILYQWMSESAEEEPLLLQNFANFLTSASCTIQYNGNRFDQPFLEERFRTYEISSPFDKIPSLDVYLLLKPLQGFFKLPHMKQLDLEFLLPLSPRVFPDGGQCIRMYRTFLKSRDPKAAQTVLGHNEEDLRGLGAIFELLAFCALLDENYVPVSAELINDEHGAVSDMSAKPASELTENSLRLVLSLPLPVPTAVSNGNKDFYISVSESEARLLIPLSHGRLKQFYSNYKDYNYLPGEDTAIARELSRYMDKALLIPATPQTCYTWFPCTEAFLKDPEMQRRFLSRNLPCYLRSLKS